MLKNIEVINRFFYGLPAHSNNLRSTGRALCSFGACIARWRGDDLLVLRNAPDAVDGHSAKYIGRHISLLMLHLPDLTHVEVVDTLDGTSSPVQPAERPTAA